jgi:hypothetical protein
MAGELMKKRLLIGTLILTIFLVNLIPSITLAYREDDYKLTRIQGIGAGHCGEHSLKATLNILLAETGKNDDSIWGIGKGRITIQAPSRGGDFDHIKTASFRINWIYGRNEETLTISGSLNTEIESEIDWRVTIANNPETFPDGNARVASELTGNLFVGEKDIDLNIKVQFFRVEQRLDAPDY